ncbi:MAG: RusA family crossover junction endodeoxyribonuclease [Alphaproteobacteria bacterium]|nr:RusA family crossover junction endodeoxyribonuclease [Alphaproteobacteria bacterium]
MTETWEYRDIAGTYQFWYKMKRDELLKRKIILSIPTAPTVNSAFRNVRGKGRVRTRKYVAWAKEAGWLLKAQNVGHIAGKVNVDMEVPRIANADIDNRIKPTLDLLQTMGVIDNDKNVEQITARWADGIQAMLVTVERVA